MNPITHPFEPVVDEHCRILILGSFPSVKSREQGFFYGHPRNRFWQVIAQVFDTPLPASIEDKKRLLLTHHIALWDVIASCEIAGSSDASIRHAVPVDITQVTALASIRKVICNGTMAGKLYVRYFDAGIDTIVLPSTSPANAAWSAEQLVRVWKDHILT